jgi:hypothetical protein
MILPLSPLLLLCHPAVSVPVLVPAPEAPAIHPMSSCLQQWVAGGCQEKMMQELKVSHLKFMHVKFKNVIVSSQMTNLQGTLVTLRIDSIILNAYSISLTENSHHYIVIILSHSASTWFSLGFNYRLIN